MATTPKMIRLDETMLTLARELFEHPSIKSRSESDLLGDATVLGLELLKAQAMVAGASLDAEPAAFARRLSTSLLPVFELLGQYQALPHWLTMPRAQPSALSSHSAVADAEAAVPPSAAQLARAPLTVAPEAKAMLAAFGTNLLDDDDED